jgi:hypothetical protein
MTQTEIEKAASEYAEAACPDAPPDMRYFNREMWIGDAHYHRKEIRELKGRIEYHRAKLDVAKLKAKEP